ncbi:pleckstrin homology domain-containing family M member 3-like isoform X2 [Myxocyprinus asiaticus]|uniref:pleckstrin homology domain-containing family M member 3-like isoform X2 n=1 Tax=Myxocyprinus asiaticus TaxID=70543 RepID=UPI0022233BBF|nr:pleckstrin homology domain-containing family M member 3-like isoform X2 [Myxocyprinus asiaticus]
MEGLEVEDISPALEATEDYLHCLDDNYGDGQVCPLMLKEASTMDKLNSSGVWGLLTGKQSEISPGNMAWAEQTSFSVLGLRHGKRNRAQSTNDLAAHAKETNSTITTSSSGFKRGHNRSRSDVNNRSYTDNGIPSIDKNTLKNVSLNEQRDVHKESSSSLVKQGMLDQREGPWGRWSTCHVELTPCELRLYSLDSSGNQQLCAALSLSHCQGVSAPQPQDGRVLQAVFFNSTRVQLRASCQWEALEWRRLLWERVLAARPAHHERELAHATSPISAEPDTDAASVPTPRPLVRPTALPLFTQHCASVLKAGLLHQLTDLNNWRAFTFVLSRTELQAFPTEGRGPVWEPVLRYRLASCLAVQRDEEDRGLNARFQAVFPDDVLRLRAESEPKAQDWLEALRTAVTAQRPQLENYQSGPTGVLMRSKPARERQHREAQRAKRQSVTTSFLSILTCLAVEKGLTAQSFRCAGCQRPVGLSRGKAKVCSYSGWYYCPSCHQDNLFLIPARLLHNWDTNKHEVSKQAKEFLEFVFEEPLLDVQQLNQCLYEHCEALAAILKLRQQLQSLRAYLFSCRATVAEDLRRRIFPREYLLQHVHLYSLADLQQGQPPWSNLELSALLKDTMVMAVGIEPATF